MPGVPAGSKQIERAAKTRRRLVRSARRLFGRQGYADTSIEDVVRAAKLTRGALYHHFGDKRGLFQAAYEDVAAELMRRLTDAAAAEPRPELHLEVGCQAFLDACLDDRIRQILLVDGPTVLGAEVRDEINSRHADGLLTTALGVAVKTGYLRPQPVEPVAHLLLGALQEAGLRMSQASDPQRARVELGEGVEALLVGLKTDPSRR
jgi:AcrR family transcriptional regulator